MRPSRCILRMAMAMSNSCRSPRRDRERRGGSRRRCSPKLCRPEVPDRQPESILRPSAKRLQSAAGCRAPRVLVPRAPTESRFSACGRRWSVHQQHVLVGGGPGLEEILGSSSTEREQPVVHKAVLLAREDMVPDGQQISVAVNEGARLHKKPYARTNVSFPILRETCSETQLLMRKMVNMSSGTWKRWFPRSL